MTDGGVNHAVENVPEKSLSDRGELALAREDRGKGGEAAPDSRDGVESMNGADGSMLAGSGNGGGIQAERDGATLDLDALVLSDDARSDIVSRLKRIEGQARGIRKMIEDGRSCEDVIIQVAALKAAVAQVGIAIAGSHLVDCVARDMEASPASRAALARFVKIFSKLS
ncbi:MAG: metal-sensitive transcriptional regulator [Firmicutes bacterium]|jgi:DNA-binding FrmR family transcriptional regulator|nr:metal-sensitive transcriptional regulator [Bacillota bacterium]MDH7495343.1 metal-sensitive transcriptional regulator [Bacillota bacterium]